MAAVGLTIHDEISATRDAETLGVRLNFNRNHISVSSSRGWRLREACRELAKRRTFNGGCLEKVAGHQSFAGLLSRLSLSVLFATYKFCRAHYLDTAVLWVSVREEQRAFAALVLLVEANMALPWATIAYCSDASLSGGAYAMRHVSVALASRVGRVREKSRFRCDESAAFARRHALLKLGLGGLLASRKGGLLLNDEDPDFEDSTDAHTAPVGYVANHDFDEVPAAMLCPSECTLISSFPWSRSEVHLNLGGAGSFVCGSRRVSSDSSCFSYRHADR